MEYGNKKALRPGGREGYTLTMRANNVLLHWNTQALNHYSVIILYKHALNKVHNNYALLQFSNVPT